MHSHGEAAVAEFVHQPACEPVRFLHQLSIRQRAIIAAVGETIGRRTAPVIDTVEEMHRERRGIVYGAAISATFVRAEGEFLATNDSENSKRR
jgi:hypothetical protein